MKKVFGMLVIVLVALTIAIGLAFTEPWKQGEEQRSGGQQGEEQPGGGQRGGGPRGGGPRGGPQNEIRFLFTEEGREDFGLTEEETTAIQEALRALAPQRNPDATPDERREAMEKSAAEATAKLGELLTEEQMTKLQTRAFQLGGYAGLNGRYAQNALKITDEQKTQIDEIARENRRGPGGPGGPGGGPGGPGGGGPPSEEQMQEMRARMEESRKVLGEKFKEILTEEQIAEADKLLEEIPDYIKEARQRPPFGGGRGGR